MKSMLGLCHNCRCFPFHGVQEHKLKYILGTVTLLLMYTSVAGDEGEEDKLEPATKP